MYKHDLTGRVFGQLTVIQYAGGRRWLVQCVCGTTKQVLSYSITSGHTRSCGCLQREIATRLATKHNGCGTAEYNIWYGMISRCNDPRDKSYCNYGGRGIVVCNQWRESFSVFLADMGPRPTSKHQLDRYPNNDGNYEPGNCRWATQTEQARNRRNNHRITHNGISLTLVEWADRISIRATTIRQRLKYGWSVERALSTPLYIRKG